MAEWKRIARSEDVKEGQPLVIDLDDEESVLVTRLEGSVCACDNERPHYGGPLGDGVLRGAVVRCPYHNAALVDAAFLRGRGWWVSGMAGVS